MLRPLPTLICVVQAILYASCAKTKSLTFVIDDTASMRDDIDQVLQEVDGITKAVLNKPSEIENFVLITFNDPEVKLRSKTKNRRAFERALSSIEVHSTYNYDCPEYSLSGLEMALFESRPRSYIYVFTDASAKDYKKVDRIKDLCQKTQSKVVFILTGNCRRPNDKKYNVYHDIATASSGLVLEVEKQEVNLVVKTINTFTEGNINPVKSVTIDASPRLVHVPFSVDVKTKYAIISCTGKNVEINVDGLDAEVIMSTQKSKILQLKNPTEGNYSVAVKARTKSHLVIYARTDFSFLHGFSQTQPKTINDTSRKPLANLPNLLSIMIEDPHDSVEIESAQLLDLTHETPISAPLPLKEISDHFYITQPFVSPEFPFKLAVNGHYVDNGRPIKSLAKTPIYPNIVDTAVKKKPTVTISEGDNTTAIMGSQLILTCKVHAYPEPKIVWTDEFHKILRSNSSCVEKPYDFISYLNLTSVKKENKYTCTASNTLGSVKKNIDVKIGDPFKVTLRPEEKTRAKYGESTSLKCLISSDFDMKITWYFNGGYGTKKLRTNDIYTVSSDGTELVIKSMKKDLAGKYTCNAALTSDDYIHKRFSTDIEMYGFETPVINNLVSFMKAQESEAVTIPCIINQGRPKPTIKWQYRTKGVFVDVDVRKDIRLHITKDGLQISKSSLRHSGEYKCIAENDAGTDEHTTTVIINKQPEINIIGGTEIKLKYGDEAQIECKATGNPLPKIEWREEDGTVVPPESLGLVIRHQYYQNSILELKNQKRSKKLYCYSENTLGKDMKAIDVIVGSPFQVISHSEGTMNVSYAEEVTVICDVKSHLPMEINWYYTNDKTDERTKLTPSTAYSILLNGSALKIHSMDLESVGKYTCNATLIFDEDQYLSYDTRVQIQGLKKPKIAQDPDNVITTLTASEVTLECRVLEGYPKPTITWEFQRRGSHTYLPLSTTGEQLKLPNVEVIQSGQYRCVAKNVLGQDSKTKELVVNMIPVTNISEGSHINLSYRDEVNLTCVVIAYPPPKIMWTNSMGIILKEETPSERPDHRYQLSTHGWKIKKSDNLSCHASNYLGKVVKNIDVTVAAPFEVENKPEGQVNVEYGKTHVIQCHITSPLNMTIRWFKIPETKEKPRPMKSSDKLSISSDGTELTIGFMAPNLDGTYICTASLNDDVDETISYDTKIKTTGLVSPVLDKDNLHMNVRAESNVTIFCWIKAGSPHPNIKWYFKSKPGSVPYKFNETRHALHIPKVTLEDAGYYLCEAENIVGKDQHEIELTVEAPPVISYFNTTTYTAIVGDVVLRIPCLATGSPKPTISWQVNGSAISPDSKYKIVEGALLVRTPSENDTLEYTCTAKNKLGDHSVTFDGIVTDTMDDYEMVHNVYIKKGSSDKLNCSLAHSESDTIKWFLNGYATNQTGPHIDLKDATELMDGNYSCRISNENGYNINTYEVDVGYSPTFSSYQDEIIDWKSDRSLDCAVNAKPAATTQWYFEGKAIKTNEDSEKLPITEWGLYTCKVSNIHGSVNRSFNVTSFNCLIDMEKNNYNNTPLLLTENLKWPHFEINRKFLVIPHNENLVLSCQSKENPSNSFQTMPEKTKVEASCVGQDNLLIGDKIYKYSDLRCGGEVMPFVKRTGEQCLNDETEMVQIGYDLDEFVEVYSICYDTKRNVPLYSKMNMMDMNNIITPSNYDWFNYSDVSHFNNEVYSCAKSNSCCIAKEQLVSVHDVVFGPAKQSTFFDGFNSIPVWQNCNEFRSSWRQIENRVREYYDLTSTFGVWTGANDYVDTDKGKIPQYLWKVVRLDESYSLAIIYVNDPHPNDSQVLCNNVCEDYLGKNFDDKYTYCCELIDFLTAFNVTEEAIGGI